MRDKDNSVMGIIATDMLDEMFEIESRAVAGDFAAQVAISAAGGHMFTHSIIENFEPVPEGVNPIPISVAKRQ